MLCTSGLDDMEHATSSGTNKTRPDKKRRKQCRYAIEVTLIYFNTLFAIGAISTRFIKSGKFWTQPDTIQSKPWTNWLQNSQKVANLPFYWTIVDSFQLQGAIPTRSPWPPDRGLCPWTQGLKTLFVSRRTSCYGRRTTCSVREDKVCPPSLSKSSD